MSDSATYNDLILDDQLQVEVVVTHRIGYAGGFEENMTTQEIEEADAFLERYVQYRIAQALTELEINADQD